MEDNAFSMMMIGMIMFVTIVIFFGVVQSRREAKRRQELLLLAHRMGLDFSLGDMFGIPSLYGDCDWFSQGIRQKALNVMHGRIDNLDIKAFDYCYETVNSRSNGKTGIGSLIDMDGSRSRDTDTHSFSAVAIDTGFIFRSLLIRPEGLGDKLAAAFGFGDIDFESAEFSRKFFVKSDDKKFAYAVIHTRMMDFLMRNTKWQVQMRLRSIIIYNGRMFSASEFGEAINFARDFLNLLPEYLLNELKITKEAT